MKRLTSDSGSPARKEDLNTERIERLLEDKGVRPTANRILVARMLGRAERPASLADLEAMLGHTVNKASIFRSLETFAAHGIVHEIEDGSRSLKYELCHSAAGHAADGEDDDMHVHFYCEKCGRTFCLDGVGPPPVDLPDGFKARSVNYMIKGACPGCGD